MTVCPVIGVILGLRVAVELIEGWAAVGLGTVIVGIVLGVDFPVQEVAIKAKNIITANTIKNTLRITLLRITTIHHSILKDKNQI